MQPFTLAASLLWIFLGHILFIIVRLWLAFTVRERIHRIHARSGFLGVGVGRAPRRRRRREYGVEYEEGCPPRYWGRIWGSPSIFFFNFGVSKCVVVFWCILVVNIRDTFYYCQCRTSSHLTAFLPTVMSLGAWRNCSELVPLWIRHCLQLRNSVLRESLTLLPSTFSLRTTPQSALRHMSYSPDLAQTMLK